MLAVSQQSEWFSIKTGVRQGDVLSPLLFIIFMDLCFRDIGVGEHREEALAYADDVVTDTVVDLQEIMNKWHAGVTENGMKINTARDKTEFMMVSRRDEQYEIEMGLENIGQGSEYKNLTLSFLVNINN